jgi:hypothetical protein
MRMDAACAFFREARGRQHPRQEDRPARQAQAISAMDDFDIDGMLDEEEELAREAVVRQPAPTRLSWGTTVPPAHRITHDHT